jgi:hypothetical protein
VGAPAPLGDDVWVDVGDVGMKGNEGGCRRRKNDVKYDRRATPLRTRG